MFAANEMLSTRVLAANEVDNLGIGGNRLSDGSKHVEPKIGKSESQKSAKSLKLSKSRNLKGKKLAKSKKLLKSRNSPNFDIKEAGPSFLTPKTRSIFNRLWLAFTEALIFQHFDSECHIRIKTNALGYAISGVLSQLVSETKPNEIVIKIDLGQ